MLILPISIQHVASVALARRIVRDIVGLSKAEVASYCWRGISSSVNKPVIHPLCHFIIIVCVCFFFLPSCITNIWIWQYYYIWLLYSFPWKLRPLRLVINYQAFGNKTQLQILACLTVEYGVKNWLITACLITDRDIYCNKWLCKICEPTCKILYY